MSKRIILLSDGTGNSAAKVWRTNVWRTFVSLDLTQPDQIAIYDDGVGTSSFKPAAILGGAFGFGMKRNVLSLYKFLCRNYKSKADYQKDGVASEADEIFAFGFSRGAFTIRVLVDFVTKQGLVVASTEAELDSKAKAAYRVYREEFKTRTRIETPLRKIRNLFVPATHNKDERPVAHVRFLGLWDTVAAYGLPVDEMTYGISRYLWPLEFPDRLLNTKVQRACHALSLDDERTTFHPVLWDESELRETGELAAKPKPGQARVTMDEKVSQVWFAGVHANVGGGYPDDSLAHVSLNWMLDQAKACNLRLKSAPTADPDAFKNMKSAEDSDGRLYDSRSGFASYYRYGPRSVTDISDPALYTDLRDRVSIRLAKIHESVFARMRINAHVYAPLSLPEKYEIVRADSKIVSPDDIRDTANAPPKYEPSANAADRFKQQEYVTWSFVWRRRMIYFLTVVASVQLAAYPLFSYIPAEEETMTRFRLVSDLVRLIGRFIPAQFTPWIEAYAREPVWFMISAGAVAGLLWASSLLKARITDEAKRNWDASFGRVKRARPAGTGSLTKAPLGVLEWAAIAVTAGAALCLPLKAVFAPHLGQHLWPSLDSFTSRLSHGYIFFIAATTLITLGLPTTTVAKFRTTAGYKKAVQYIKRRVFPFLFAFSFAFLGIYFAVAFGNHYLANIRDSFGHFCKTSLHGPLAEQNASLAVCRVHDIGDLKEIAGCAGATTDQPIVPGVTTAKTLTVNTQDICTPTGIYLSKKQLYMIQVSEEEKGSWTFAGLQSSTAGVRVEEFGKPTGERASWLRSHGRKFAAAMAYPFRRTLQRPWGTVVVRYGSTGNEEAFLDRGDETYTDHRESRVRPPRDGELFVYLNKPLLAFRPNWLDNINSGTAKITVTRIEQIRAR